MIRISAPAWAGAQAVCYIGNSIISVVTVACPPTSKCVAIGQFIQALTSLDDCIQKATAWMGKQPQSEYSSCHSKDAWRPTVEHADLLITRLNWVMASSSCDCKHIQHSWLFLQHARRLRWKPTHNKLLVVTVHVQAAATPKRHSQQSFALVDTGR